MRNREKYNEYMRVYNGKRYHERRRQSIEKLGGKCIKCGSVEELEIDHIDPNQKSFNTAKLWNCNEEKFWKEIDKCQLLCKEHHNEKSVLEKGKQLVKGTNIHGTISSYRYCKCHLCIEAKHKSNREYNSRRNELRKLKKQK